MGANTQGLCLLVSPRVPLCSPSCVHAFCGEWGHCLAFMLLGPGQVQEIQSPQSWTVSQRQLYQVSPDHLNPPPRGDPLLEMRETKHRTAKRNLLCSQLSTTWGLLKGPEAPPPHAGGNWVDSSLTFTPPGSGRLSLSSVSRYPDHY